MFLIRLEENEKIEEFYYRVYDHLKLIKEDTIIFIDAIDQLINEDGFSDSLEIGLIYNKKERKNLTYKEILNYFYYFNASL